jgi:hypothetical protein
MSTTVSLKRFNKQVDNFLVALKKIFPERKEFSIFEAQMEGARMINKRIVIDSFITYVYPFKGQIMNKDESFFLQEGNVGVKKDYMSHALNLKDLWLNSLRPENKEMVWKYFQVMILLAEKSINSVTTKSKSNRG